nr:hypothetical protein [Bradyrhizobium sp. SZCCHNS2002]
MDGDIGHHAPAHERLPDEVQEQFSPGIAVKLMGKGQVDFTRKLGVLAGLQLLNVIPEALAVAQDGSSPEGKEDLRMHHPATIAVVVHESGALVSQPFTGTIGCSGEGRLPLRPTDHLHREMIARHAWLSEPSAIKMRFLLNICRTMFRM